MAKWTYLGDINVEHGGYWFKPGVWEDIVDVIEVIPDTDMGGADNVFHISCGIVHINKENFIRDRVLKNLGWLGTVEEAPFQTLVEAFKNYYGVEAEGQETIRIGNIDPLTQPATVKEDWIFQIRGTNKLKNYLKKHWVT